MASKAFLSNQVQLGVGGPIWEAVAVDPSAGAGLNRPIGSVAILTVGVPDIFFKVGAGNTDWMPTHASGFMSGIFGDGSIAPLVVAGATNEASAVGDVYFESLTVQNGGVYKPQGRRIYVRDTLTIDAGGDLNLNGNNAVAAVGGLATTGYITLAGTAGGTGTTTIGGIGTATTSIAVPNGTGTSLGGAGGLGTGGAGGIAGTQGANGAFGSIRELVLALTGFSAGASQASIGPATGGGGGGGNTVNNGGGGGGGAGTIIITARRVINNGTIRAIGGNGAAGTANNCGGGGGGGGGRIIIVTRQYIGAAPVVTHGTGGGTGGGGGAPGADGADGLALVMTV